jgi:nucleoside-diphosphate-sugar epimerase
LVVGGAGYVGSVLSRELLQAGYRVRVLDAFLYGGTSLDDIVGHPRLEIMQGDTRDERRVRQALEGVDAVVHLGEIVGDPACALDPDLTIDINITSSIRLARLAREAGIRRFVYPSSCSVYGASDEIVNERSRLNPVSLYARGKISVEEAILEMTGPDFHPVIVRFATVYGLSPRPRFDLVVNLLTAKAQTDGEIIVDGGDQWRPFLHVADAADALQLCLEQPARMVAGEVFNVGGNDQNHTIGEVAEIIRNRIPRASVRYGEVRDRRNYRVRFDKIENQLGFVPKRLLVEGIDEIARALDEGSIPDFGSVEFSNLEALRDAGVGQLSTLTPVMTVREAVEAESDMPRLRHLDDAVPA